MQNGARAERLSDDWRARIVADSVQTWMSTFLTSWSASNNGDSPSETVALKGIADVPPELLGEAVMVSSELLFAMAPVCVAWRALAMTEARWYALVVKRWGEEGLPPTQRWRSFFIQRYCRERPLKPMDVSFPAFLETTYLVVEFTVRDVVGGNRNGSGGEPGVVLAERRATLQFKQALCNHDGLRHPGTMLEWVLPSSWSGDSWDPPTISRQPYPFLSCKASIWNSAIDKLVPLVDSPPQRVISVPARFCECRPLCWSDVVDGELVLLDRDLSIKFSRLERDPGASSNDGSGRSLRSVTMQNPTLNLSFEAGTDNATAWPKLYVEPEWPRYLMMLPGSHYQEEGEVYDPEED